MGHKGKDYHTDPLLPSHIRTRNVAYDEVCTCVPGNLLTAPACGSHIAEEGVGLGCRSWLRRRGAGKQEGSFSSGMKV